MTKFATSLRNPEPYRMQFCNQLYTSKARLYLLFFLCLAFSFSGFSQAKNASIHPKIKTFAADSLNKIASDTANTASPQELKPNQIDAEIKYSAQDSIEFFGNGTGFLHGKG